jgi:RIO-like serine/threonine protein kinase
LVGFERLASLIGDGHTFVDTSKLYRGLPFDAFWFGEDLRVVRAAPKYKEAIGIKISKIGLTSINEVRQKLQQLSPHSDSEWFVMDRNAGLIT